jgi:hypothetical protein
MIHCIVKAVVRALYNALWTLIWGATVWRGRRVLFLACGCGTSACRRNEPNTTHGFEVMEGRARQRTYLRCGSAVSVRRAGASYNHHVHLVDYGDAWLWASDPNVDVFRAQHLLVASVESR